MVVELVRRDREREQSMSARPVSICKPSWRYYCQQVCRGRRACVERTSSGDRIIRSQESAAVGVRGIERRRTALVLTRSLWERSRRGLMRHLATASSTAASAIKLGDRNSLHWSGVVVDEEQRPALASFRGSRASRVGQMASGFQMHHRTGAASGHAKRCPPRQSRSGLVRRARQSGVPLERGWHLVNASVSREAGRDWQAAVIVGVDDRMQRNTADAHRMPNGWSVSIY